MDEERLDQLLRGALMEANRREYETVGEDSVSIMWSMSYQRQKRKMLDNPMRWYRNKIMPLWRKVGRAVAGILLTFLVGLSAVLVVSPSARAAFFAWVQEVYETHIVYRFLGEPAVAELQQYEIANLPQEYREVDRFTLSGQVSVTYESDSGQMIYFDCFSMEQGGASFIITDSMWVEDVSVNGYDGQLYCSQDPMQSNILIWRDTSKNIQFSIDAFEDVDTLLLFAKNIALKK